VGSKHGEGPPDAVMQSLAESATRMVAQGLHATLRGASRGDVVKAKDPAEGRDGLGHRRVVSLPLLGRLSKRLGGLTKGRLELCEQPKRKTSNTSEFSASARLSASANWTPRASAWLSASAMKVA
jgi:hypothetical protein